MRRFPRFLALFACAALGVSGCTGWRQVAVSPTALVDNPAHVQVTRRDGTRITLTDPRIAADSLYGEHSGKELVLPLHEVSRIAVQKPATAKNAAALTFAAAGLGAALGWFAYFAVAQ